jgi:hypothetical protein
MSAQVIRPVLGAVVGAGVGLAVYKLVGCRTGACPLTGSPWVSMLLWAVIGAMLAASPR